MSAEEENRQLHAARSQRLADVPAVRIREPDVDDQEIRFLRPDPLEQLGAAARADGRKSLFLEAAEEHAAQVEIVLDDHHLWPRHEDERSVRIGPDRACVQTFFSLSLLGSTGERCPCRRRNGYSPLSACCGGGM